jgi:hypothetical protein
MEQNWYLIKKYFNGITEYVSIIRWPVFIDALSGTGNTFLINPLVA